MKTINEISLLLDLIANSPFFLSNSLTESYFQGDGGGPLVCESGGQWYQVPFQL